jgi:DNA-binding beta-propeller fold protein YncE
MMDQKVYGTGDYRYGYVPGWAKLPAGWVWGAGTGVAVDARDNLYFFNRSDHPVIVFDRQGNFLRSWGEGVFKRPHGVFITPEQFVWGADDGDHVIRKFDLEGRLLETLGVQGKPSDTGYIHEGDLQRRLDSIQRSAGPFHRPTKLVPAPWGELYASDGYGNARVHRFGSDGTLIGSWGEPGREPGQFRLPHGLAVDGRGRILVADRENSRVQLFSRDGDLLEVWNDLAKASDVAIGKEDVVYVSELPRGVCILDQGGKVLSRFDAVQDKVLRQAHALCVDSRGDIYVVEIAEGSPTLHKFARV